MNLKLDFGQLNAARLLGHQTNDAGGDLLVIFDVWP